MRVCAYAQTRQSICCLHTQSMDVDEEPYQTLDLSPRIGVEWMFFRICIKYQAQSCVLAHSVYMQYTFTCKFIRYSSFVQQNLRIHEKSWNGLLDSLNEGRTYFLKPQIVANNHFVKCFHFIKLLQCTECWHPCKFIDSKEPNRLIVHLTA